MMTKSFNQKLEDIEFIKNEIGVLMMFFIILTIAVLILFAIAGVDYFIFRIPIRYN